MIETTKKIESLLSEVEKSFLEKDFAQALVLTQKIPRDQLRRSNAATVGAYFHWYAKSLNRLGEFTKARRKIRTAIWFARKAKSKDLLARAKYTHGLILQQVGELIKAEVAYNESNVAFIEAGDHNARLGPLDAHAALHYSKGKLRRARELILEEIQICEEYGFQDDGIRCKFNLSRVLYSEGKFQDALQMLSSIEAEKKDISITNRISNLRGMIYCMQLKTDQAESLLSQAKEYYESRGEHRDSVVCLEYLGLNEYFAGNYKRAKRYYLDILNRKEITISARAQTLRLLTDVYVAQGRFRKALSIAHQAKEAIEISGERIEHAALYRAFGEIYEDGRKRDTARDYFKSSVDLLKECGAKFELALTYSACGTSRAYKKKERLDFQNSAHELFTQLDVARHFKRTIKLPLVDLKLTAKQVQLYIGWPLLATSVLTCMFSFSIILFSWNMIGASVFFGSGILAYETFVMMRITRNKERKKATSLWGNILTGPANGKLHAGLTKEKD